MGRGDRTGFYSYSYSHVWSRSKSRSKRIRLPGVVPAHPVGTDDVELMFVRAARDVDHLEEQLRCGDLRLARFELCLIEARVGPAVRLQQWLSERRRSEERRV